MGDKGGSYVGYWQYARAPEETGGEAEAAMDRGRMWRVITWLILLLFAAVVLSMVPYIGG